MRFKKSWAVGAVSAAVLATLVPFAPQASAVTPPWEPDPNASAGTVAFYDASGTRIYGGNNLAHLFDYAAASSGPFNGRVTTKAGTIFSVPDHSKTGTSITTWTNFTSSANTVYPVAGAPGALASVPAANPVATVGASEANLNNVLAVATLDNTAGYANMMQIRLKDIGPGGGNGILASPYWATDISYNVAAGTWAVVFPAPPSGPTTTTTTVGASPASPQNAGTNVTFTATVSPTAAGSVQFKDGANNLGSSVAVDGTGHASTSTTALSVAAHTITAVFTPTDSGAFSPSTSAGFPYTITSAAVATTTTLGITPASPITVGTSSTLTATLSPAGAVGSVTFFDGASPINSAVTVTSGQAQTTTSFSLNTHNVKAVFTPTDSNAFSGSQSAVQAYTVNSAPATPTSTTLTSILPASPQTFGTTLTFSGSVSPITAVGKIQFLEGVTVIGEGNVSNSTGVATATSSTLSATTHSIVAKFVPTTPADFGTSTSNPATSFTVSKASTTVSLGAAPSSPQVQGTQVTLTASTGPAGQGGSVQFSDNGSPIGSAVAVNTNTNTATFASSALSVGSHSFTAAFTPSSANYSNSSSSAVPFTISQPPPGATTTALTVSPASPVIVGTLETLHATISPASAAGTVTFKDGDTVIASGVAVAGGVAQTTTTLGVGDHSLTADFTPSNNFDPSSSAAQAYTVKQPAATTTTLSTTPSGPVPYGTSLTLNASVVSASAAGSVEFFDGATSLGSSPVAGGAASKMVTNLVGGSHNLSATFHSSAPLDFANSTSNTVPLNVTALDTTCGLAVTPGGPVTSGTEVTLTATVAPSAPGTVTFKNGTTTLGTAPVVSGHATLTTTTVPLGTASLTAEFTATTPANYNPSASDPLTLEVVAPPKFDSITSDGQTIHNGETLAGGQKLDVNASGFQSGEDVTITVHSTPVVLGHATADEQGDVHAVVTIPTSLGSGEHTLTLSGAIGSVVLSFLIAAPAGPGTPGTPGGGGTANTGTDVLGGSILGLVLLVAGLLAMEAGSRRRRAGKHRIG